MILAKTPRVSGVGESIAHTLSKRRMEEAKAQSSRFNEGPSETPIS